MTSYSLETGAMYEMLKEIIKNTDIQVAGDEILFSN